LAGNREKRPWQKAIGRKQWPLSGLSRPIKFERFSEAKNASLSRLRASCNWKGSTEA
jgi:hypothetical protein